MQTKGSWIFKERRINTYVALRLSDGRLFFEHTLFDKKYYNLVEASVADTAFLSKKLAEENLCWNPNLGIFIQTCAEPEIIHPEYVPFESKVLVRNEDLERWVPAFWGYENDAIDGRYIVVGGGAYKQCIPYEGNEKLLGTAVDCPLKYKSWMLK